MTQRQFGTRRELLNLGGAALAGSTWAFGPHSAVAMDLQGHGPDSQPWTSSNPALSGAIEPVFDEWDGTDLKVEGEIPRGLRGVSMRNGPNPQFKPDDHYAYPFDETRMVQSSISKANARIAIAGS